MSIEIKPSNERKCTNYLFLIFANVFIGITIFLVVYCGIVGIKTRDNDFKLVDSQDHEVKGLKDSCGNICRKKNTFKGSACGNRDKRGYPKLLVRKISLDKQPSSVHFSIRECIKECPEGYFEKSNQCIKNEFQELFVEAMKATWMYILFFCFVTFVFSYIFLILFRYAAKYVIWVINIGLVVLIFVLAISRAIDKAYRGATSLGILGSILIIVLIFFRKRIALVAKLFKEASKALIDVPAIMFEPILTFISLLISVVVSITFFIIILYADVDKSLANTAHICNIISFIFITQFIIGCQNFIIAGTICRWYFTRDKTKLRKPIRKSFSHLFKFHLGSVCLGAILITIFKIIRFIISRIKSSVKNPSNCCAFIIAACCMCFIDVLDKFLSFMIRNAYIIVAKEGTGFCDSGRRAGMLLLNNVTDVIALNHFGDLVLFVCRLLIVLMTGFVGITTFSQAAEQNEFFSIALIIGCILAFFIAHCFVMVFEMTVDTIFVSFCIDIEENDGDTRPYYMSDSLKKIIMDMKEQAGGTFNFGPKIDRGIVIPILPIQQQPQMMYPNLGYGGPNSQPQYTQQPYPQQQYPQQPYPQQSMMPVQVYPSAPHPDPPNQQKV